MNEKNILIFPIVLTLVYISIYFGGINIIPTNTIPLGYDVDGQKIQFTDYKQFKDIYHFAAFIQKVESSFYTKDTTACNGLLHCAKLQQRNNSILIKINNRFDISQSMTKEDIIAEFYQFSFWGVKQLSTWDITRTFIMAVFCFVVGAVFA